MKKIEILTLVVSFFTYCGNAQNLSKSSTSETVDAKEYALIGKKGITTFPKMKVETDYISDSTMHWKTTNRG